MARQFDVAFGCLARLTEETALDDAQFVQRRGRFTETIAHFEIGHDVTIHTFLSRTRLINAEEADCALWGLHDFGQTFRALIYLALCTTFVLANRMFSTVTRALNRWTDDFGFNENGLFVLDRAMLLVADSCGGQLLSR